MLKKSVFVTIIGLAFLVGCRAQPQYFEQKILSHKEIAQVYIKENRYVEALNELDLAIKSSLCDICAIKRAELVLLSSHDEKARKEAEEILEKERKKCDPEIYNLLGLAYMGKREFDKAEEAFKNALRIKPDYSEAYNNLGSLMVLLQKYDEAISYFKKALENPNYVNSYIPKTNLGWVYYIKGEKELAINTLLEAYRENPRYPKALSYIGNIFFNENELEKAKFYYTQALKIDKYSGEARFYLGEIAFKEGNTELAKELWKSIILLNPDSEWAKKASERLYFLERLTQKK